MSLRLLPLIALLLLPGVSAQDDAPLPDGEVPGDFTGEAAPPTAVRWSWNGVFDAIGYELHDEDEVPVAFPSRFDESFVEEGLEPGSTVTRHLHAVFGDAELRFLGPPTENVRVDLPAQDPPRKPRICLNVVVVEGSNLHFNGAKGQEKTATAVKEYVACLDKIFCTHCGFGVEVDDADILRVRKIVYDIAPADEQDKPKGERTLPGDSADGSMFYDRLSQMTGALIALGKLKKNCMNIVFVKEWRTLDGKPFNRVLGVTVSRGTPMIYVTNQGARGPAGVGIRFASLVDEACKKALTLAHEVAHGLGEGHNIEIKELEEKMQKGELGVEELQRIASNLLFPYAKLYLPMQTDLNIRHFLGDELDEDQCRRMKANVEDPEYACRKMCAEYTRLADRDIIDPERDRFRDGKCD